MILFEELLHLVDKVVRVFLCRAKLIAKTINFLVKTSLDAIKVNVIALLILFDIYLEVPCIICIAVYIFSNPLQYMLLLFANLRVEVENFFPEHLDICEAFAWALQNDLWNEDIGTAHELLILLDLGIEQLRENLLRCLNAASWLTYHAFGEPRVVQLVGDTFVATTLLECLPSFLSLGGDAADGRTRCTIVSLSTLSNHL